MVPERDTTCEQKLSLSGANLCKGHVRAPLARVQARGSLDPDLLSLYPSHPWPPRPLPRALRPLPDRLFALP
eukprot:1882289-Rhodomonas_salina.1